MSLRITDIWRYPVKSCRGERLTAATVEPWGLRGDRRWMLVDSDGEVVTAREYPPLVLVTPLIDAVGGIRLSTTGLPDLDVPAPSVTSQVPVSVWRRPLTAALASDESAEWLTKVTGEPVRLVYLDDPTRRHTNPEYSLPADRVSFADGFPLLLTSEASLAALNDWIAAGPRASEGPLPMRRFRPNVVLAGSPAWAEDDWRRLRIGDVTFRAARGCDRCVFTTIDPDTAAKGKEPLATLARYRRWDGAVWFGINLIPDAPGPSATISQDDPVEILE
jgi:uncharacterized protein YcbX